MHAVGAQKCYFYQTVCGVRDFWPNPIIKSVDTFQVMIVPFLMDLVNQARSSPAWEDLFILEFALSEKHPVAGTGRTLSSQCAYDHSVLTAVDTSKHKVLDERAASTSVRGLPGGRAQCL